MLTYSVSPPLPHGLKLNPLTGAIYGRPTGRWSRARRPKWHASRGIRSRWRPVRPSTKFTMRITDAAGDVASSVFTAR